MILGLTFKEDCPDLRNTKVIDIIEELKSFGASVDVYDPWIQNDIKDKTLMGEIIKDPFEKSKNTLKSHHF